MEIEEKESNIGVVWRAKGGVVPPQMEISARNSVSVFLCGHGGGIRNYLLNFHEVGGCPLPPPLLSLNHTIKRHLCSPPFSTPAVKGS